jgi:PPM family protein phosphatase
VALSLRYAAVSDVGRTRKKNDDSGYAGPHLVMVADGMGGAAAGDLASAVAVQTMQRLDEPPPEDMLVALAGAVHRANDRLAELIEEDSAVDGMGTTVTAALFDGQRIALAHLGDSRGYLWRAGELKRITSDHTWVQSLIDEGRITEQEARVHSHRSLLLKVLDGRHVNDPDLSVHELQPGDRILLCSDGLSGFVNRESMQEVLASGTAAEVATRLLHLALEAASTDNVTVVVADVVEDPPTHEAEPVVVGSAADNPNGTMSRLRTWAGRDEATAGEALVDPDIDPEELRYAPREPKRFRWLVRAVLVVVALALIAFGAKTAYDWSQDQYYVAAHDGRVAIYQGVQADLPGITLHHVYRTEDLLLTELPTFRRSQVLDVLQAEDLQHAYTIVDNLKTFAATCAAQASRHASSTPPATSKPPRPHGQRSSAPAKPHRTSHSLPTTTPSSTTTTSSGSGNAPSECAGATPRTTTGGSR